MYRYGSLISVFSKEPARLETQRRTGGKSKEV